MRPSAPQVLLLAAAFLAPPFAEAAPPAADAPRRERARDLGIPFSGTPGPLNAITDVPGVEVGFSTLIRGAGRLAVGKGPVRTGVTVVLPRGKQAGAYPAAWFSLNGDGEMTGTVFLDDYGLGLGPIGITTTTSVGVVRDAIGAWSYRSFSRGERFDFAFGLPVVAETWDGVLNDINGLHVTQADVFAALDGARGGPVAEGNVGGGTGMIMFGFKGGTGTASRAFTIDSTRYVLGVLLQANFGRRHELTIAGAPVGREIADLAPILSAPSKEGGSLIVVVGTNAPLLPGQLRLVARRVALGVARTGTIAHESSGDLFLAFSTAGPRSGGAGGPELWPALPKSSLNPVFEATVEATEEALVNALVGAETMEGIDGNKVFAIPHDRLAASLRKYNRLD